MEGNLSEMLQGVLADPSAMEKLMGVAQNLMGGQAPTPQVPPAVGEAASAPKGSGASDAPAGEGREASAFPLPLSSLQSGNGERIALIKALRPYLSPERRRTADSLVKMLNMLKLADLNKLFKE
ncbi:MAG: hypothetical protein E7630_01090 [Ruminococcaceae bacterium]|nr:hypothetical protein [Oscillospiraceae bacterium]